MKFMFADSAERKPINFLDRRKQARTRTANDRRGQSLIEFSLIFPLLFLLIVNVINFGTYIFAWITIANAARAGAQYWITGGATINAPSLPTETQVAAVVTQDISSLLNRSTLQVEACTNNASSSPAVTCSGTYGTVTPPLDPESTQFISGTIDVKYTYKPAIALWSFPKLNIYATIPSTTIHRQAAMRIMN